MGEKAFKVRWERLLLLWAVREAEVGGEEQAAGEESREGGEPGGCIKMPSNSLESQEGWVS